jgi:thiol-disulfide isomerase/thioredoxin
LAVNLFGWLHAASVQSGLGESFDFRLLSANMKQLVFLTALLFICTAPGPQAPDIIKCDIIKYDTLTDAIKKLRGKVVVVDCWADFCLPCKREFPKLVELHRRFRDRGVACVSVALDENTSAARQRIQFFLDRQKATFPNYLLDESASFWQDKFKIDGPPVVFVFNRRGDLVRKLRDQEADYTVIDKIVCRLLDE